MSHDMAQVISATIRRNHAHLASVDSGLQAHFGGLFVSGAGV